jgi:hypothetical protein
MDAFDRLLGRQPEPRSNSPHPITPRRPAGVAKAAPSSGQVTDDQAIARYRYLLRTAPPEAIEQAHAEAFAQLTTEQRRLVLEGLNSELPPRERTNREDPQSLARIATRAELRRPGTLERTFGGMYPGGTGIGLGGFLAADFLSTIAGVVVGSAIADAIFTDGGNDQENAQADAGDSEATAGDQNFAAADADYDSGDIGGDFGGGEF